MIARLSLPAISPGVLRREVLQVTLLLMESCIIATAFIPVNASSAGHTPLAALLGVAGLMALAYLSTRLLPGTGLALRRQRLLILFLILGTVAFLTRFHVHQHIVFGSGEWPALLVDEWSGILNALTDAPITLALVLLCWWRGIHLVYREFTLQSVSLSFRMDILLMVAAGFFWESPRAGDVGFLVYCFFFFAILSMGLARVDEIAGKKEGVAQPFGPGWLIIMLLAGLLVVGLGWIVARVYSPEGFKTLGEWLAPVFQVIERVVYAIFMFLGRILEPILDFLVRIIAALLNVSMDNIDEMQPFDLGDMLPPEEAMETAKGGFPWRAILKWSVIVGIALVALLGVVYTLRKLAPRDETEDNSSSRSLLGLDEWRKDLMDGLQAGADRLSDMMSTLTRHGLGMELYAVLSVRSIYASMSRLARRRGFPRHAAITPFEYLPALKQAFPQAAHADLAGITDAYVGVHYGEAPSTLREVQEIRQCWERVRATGRGSTSDAVAEEDTTPSDA